MTNKSAKTLLFVSFLNLVVAMSALSSANESLVRRSLLNGRISMLAPAGFAIMSGFAKSQKYPGSNAPANVLTNTDGSVNIAFDLKPMAMKPEEVHTLETPMRQQFSGVKINAGGIRKIGDSEFLIFDVDTPAPDGTIRNLIALTSLDGRLLVISYNCTVSRDASCGALGTQIINSIVLTPKSTK